MVKHNNIIPNQHFRKDWDRRVRTWFNQPAKKEARRANRLAKAKRIAPRPLNLLRPAVRGQTIRYNSKVRAGRGFSLVELKAAGISKKAARGVGIAVDHRRRNKSEEGVTVNVNRLKFYKSKLVVFPRNPSSKRAKKGDSSAEELAQAKQVTSTNLFAFRQLPPAPKARKILPEEREIVVRDVLRKAHTDIKRWGQRERRAKEKADEAAGKSKKAAATADDGME